ncbi:hypothetical protein IMZ48_06335 [Candidatus Bathyarchaeota archaeon]|nr:hypothetical protein [Candidatus Bathyarchaeota archaeon]
MKRTATILAASAATASASVISPLYARQNETAGACAAAVELDGSTNIFLDYKLHANNYYASEIAAAIPDMTEEQAAQAQKVAETGSFVWV